MQNPAIGISGGLPDYDTQAGLDFVGGGQAAPAPDGAAGGSTVGALLAQAVDMTLRSPDPKREFQAWAAAYATLQQAVQQQQPGAPAGPGVAAQGLPQPPVTTP